MKLPLRSCPICKKCGGKKFAIIAKLEGRIVVECKDCFSKMEI